MPFTYDDIMTSSKILTTGTRNPSRRIIHKILTREIFVCSITFVNIFQRSTFWFTSNFWVVPNTRILTIFINPDPRQIPSWFDKDTILTNNHHIVMKNVKKKSLKNAMVFMNVLLIDYVMVKKVQSAWKILWKKLNYLVNNLLRKY